MNKAPAMAPPAAPLAPREREAMRLLARPAQIRAVAQFVASAAGK